MRMVWLQAGRTSTGAEATICTAAANSNVRLPILHLCLSCVAVLPKYGYLPCILRPNSCCPCTLRPNSCCPHSPAQRPARWRTIAGRRAAGRPPVPDLSGRARLH